MHDVDWRCVRFCLCLSLFACLQAVLCSYKSSENIDKAPHECRVCLSLFLFPLSLSFSLPLPLFSLPSLSPSGGQHQSNRSVSWPHDLPPPPLPFIHPPLRSLPLSLIPFLPILLFLLHVLPLFVFVLLTSSNHASSFFSTSSFPSSSFFFTNYSSSSSSFFTSASSYSSSSSFVPSPTILPFPPHSLPPPPLSHPPLPPPFRLPAPMNTWAKKQRRCWR